MDVLTVEYGSPEAAHQFVHSLRHTGFAVIRNHPIPQELIQSVFSEWADFFRRPDKERYRFDPELQSGYFPFKSENSKDSPIKDLKEFFHLYHWSTLPEGMSDASRDLFDRLQNLALELLAWSQDGLSETIRNSLSMPLPQMTQGSRETLLRPIHYPPIEGEVEPGAIRAAAHEDINLITLLPAASAPGLEVQDLTGKWHEVICDRGTIAVNAGDMLQMATQGFYRSTTHRVVNPKGMNSLTPRYSMPLFLHPRADVPLSSEHTAGSYLKQRLREIGLLKKS
jgi:isopenicillin N synthase-like dioxygenase